MKRNLVQSLVIFGLIWGASVSSHAATVVVPNSLATVEGNSNNAFPFNITAFGIMSMRYQQVFAASQFSSIGGPVLITQILFRPDAQASAFSSTLPDIQINLSTTAAAPDALSASFASNVGADDTVVYNRGPLALSSASTGPVGGPKTFDIVINLTTPFLYDPALGNLLLDVRNFAGGTTDQFDAQQTSGDPVSRVYAISGGATATSGSPDTTGLVAAFTVTPSVSAVPEPSSVLLFSTVLGTTIFGFRRRFRKSQA